MEPVCRLEPRPPDERGLSLAPFVFAASLITDFVVYTGPRGWLAPAATSLVLTCGLTGLAAVLRGQWQSERANLAQTLALLTVAPIRILLTAFGYCSVLYVTGQLSSWSFVVAVRSFWIGDTLGIVTVVPAAAAVLGLLSTDWRQALRKHVVYAAVFLTAVVAALWTIFGISGSHEYQLFYLLFLPIVWIAVRAGLAGVSLALLLAHILLVTVAKRVGYSVYDFAAFQMLMLVLSGTGLLLGTAVSQGCSTAERLRIQQAELARAARHALVGATGTALAHDHEISQPLASATNYLHAARRLLRWPRLFGQFFRFDEWSLCRG